MINYTNKLLIIILLAGFGCQSKSELEFDSVTWKNDKNGCDNKRIEMYGQLKSIKDDLLGKSEVEINQFFGKPDFSELGANNTHAFNYYMESGKKCGENRFAKILSIEFGATNNVVIVSFQKW